MREKNVDKKIKRKMCEGGVLRGKWADRRKLKRKK